ncbi:putative fimbrial protein SthD [Acinetobacter baumannii]|uniref:fimbrial protein n=1 Tax=Serratia ureilytica TaxID=300181 RepID=UPI000B8E903E|nr:fimbrial protein [Serratia ureilytica]MEB5994527.1 type 1 fimbrial protein [Serratia ureilytica]SVK52680.1 putative fimbrial protein SthD [Acinetobacter baumannii]
MKKVFGGLGCSLALAGLLFLASPMVHAVSKIVITGNIKAAPCEIDGANGTISVNLGNDISAATLATSGAFSPWVEFPLTLKNCPSTTTSVVATFSGTPAEENASLYKSNGGSRRVQIELQNSEGANLGNGKSMTQLVSRVTNEAKFNLRARAYSTHGGSTPGSIDGALQVTFVYQ